jgi:carboxyl-terminal processing protease
MRKSCRTPAACASAVLFLACASAGNNTHDGEPVSTEIAVETFDSLWSKVSNTYVDTAFVANEWVKMRDSLRPRARLVTTRTQLDRLLRDALHHIHDSHFYIIPARIASPESAAGRTGGKGATGLSVRVADGQLVVWRAARGSVAWNAGIRSGSRIAKIQGRDTDSAMKHVRELPDQAQPLELANMLHGFNGMLNPGVGDTVLVTVIAQQGKPKRYSLVATQGEGTVSQFGNLPPIAGLVTVDRLASPVANHCIGVIAFNIWLPALAPDLEHAVDSVRTCDGIVIDLRGNPGGVGGMVMGFGGYFMDTTRSLGTMRSRQVSLRFVINPRSSRSDGRAVPPFMGPLAILVDPMSASTSEIFAAGMQRIGRARVFGEPSARAALPAMMERLPSGDVFVHAVADFTDPAGRRIEGAGAVPDEIVPLTIADILAGTDAPLDAAVRWIASGKKS